MDLERQAELVENTGHYGGESATDRPSLEQESTYDGYVVLEEPFTSTDRYLYLDAFFIGLALDDFYDYSDTCLDAWVFFMDDRAYLTNNRTLVADDPDEFWLHPLLNVTGLIGGPMSDIVPECY